MIKLLKYCLPPVVWACLIFFMSSLQGVSMPPFPYADKIIHLFVYMVLGFLTARGLRGFGVSNGLKLILISSVIVLLYGLTDEFHQMFVPTRTAEAFDLLSDLVGGLAGSAILAKTNYS